MTFLFKVSTRGDGVGEIAAFGFLEYIEWAVGGTTAFEADADNDNGARDSAGVLVLAKSLTDKVFLAGGRGVTIFSGTGIGAKSCTMLVTVTYLLSIEDHEML